MTALAVLLVVWCAFVRAKITEVYIINAAPPSQLNPDPGTQNRVISSVSVI